MDLDISQYINIFVEESKEHLQNMNDVLLELEKNPSDIDHINEIFRVAHTLKGMSGTMGFHHMAKLTHEMENLLQAVRSEELVLTEEMIDIIFECFDAIDASVNNIIEEGTEDENDHYEIVEKITEILDSDSSRASVSSQSTGEDSSYIDDVIVRAKESNLNVFNIGFKLEESCMLKAARAFIIFSNLEDNGEIIHASPSVEDIEDEKFELEFSVVLVTERDRDYLIKNLSGISELESVTITDVERQDAIGQALEPKERAEIKKETIKIEAKKEPVVKDSDKKSNNNKVNSKVGKTVRVDIDRLDNLMNLVSELIIIKTRMDDVNSSSNTGEISETIEYLERITTSLHDAVMKVRMVPIERVFNRFPRLVRDLSKDLDKEIDLEMSGEETEVDRTVIDEIGDPLIHLIRNSIDHGIELPDVREAAGKDRKGTVVLKAYPDGNNVVIEVEDDGGGIDPEKIKNKAIEKEIITEKEAENLSIEDTISLLFAAGFSTTEVVSDVSGRGVGLDVVKSKIESINGNIEVQSTKGKGSKFIIRIPLTLAIIQALLVNLKDEIYAIPLSSIREITTIYEDNIRDVQGQEITLYRGNTIPVIRLRSVIGLDSTDGNSNDTLSEGELVTVIVKKGDKEAGLIVDNLIGQQEIVIKGLGRYLSGIPYLSGATILGNGNISLILDVNSLI